MIMSEERHTLAGILFLQRKGTHDAHAVLNEHQFRPGYVITHDFMAHEVPQDDGNEQTDVRWADYVAHFLNKTRPKVMVCSPVLWICQVALEPLTQYDSHRSSISDQQMIYAIIQRKMIRQILIFLVWYFLHCASF
jgi:hypothetical protein